MYIISVKEQAPTGGSIFCEVSIDSKCGGVGIRYHNMYFVCDLGKRVTQYFDWLKEYKQQLKKLGYEF